MFVSDNIGDFEKEQLDVLKDAFKPTKLQVLDAEYVSEDDIVITYMDNKEMYRLEFNIKDERVKQLKLSNKRPIAF